MIAPILSLLPTIITVAASVFLTWLICRLWYTRLYIHRSEVRPLQESQHIMQNQYAILAERIKNTDAQLADTKTKLETALAEQKESLIKIGELEAANTGQTTVHKDWELLRSGLMDELRSFLSENNAASKNENEIETLRLKEQLNIIRQSFKEFKTEFVQKFNTSTNQYHELSNQLWQIIDLNKKMAAEAETLNKSIQASSGTEDKSADRQFTLTSIKKRS
jgi:DNA anti-recombination protein RmuC